jgi:hypothetical protein
MEDLLDILYDDLLAAERKKLVAETPMKNKKRRKGDGDGFYNNRVPSKTRSACLRQMPPA